MASAIATMILKATIKGAYREAGLDAPDDIVVDIIVRLIEEQLTFRINPALAGRGGTVPASTDQPTE